jgi:ketosteroid isomerase-like protein
MKALDTVLSFYEALGSNNALGALGLLADAASWTEMFPSLRGTWTGPEAVRRNVFEPLGHEWENFRISTESFVAEGSTVVAFGTYSGTHKGTGKSIIAPFVHRWEINNGKVSRFRQYTDTDLIAAAIA